MEWIVKIEGNEKDPITDAKLPLPNERVLVKFDPMSEEIRFIGQYKPKNKEWVNFSEEIYGIDINDLDTIQHLLAKTIMVMRGRIDAYKNINEGFSVIKLVAIPDNEQ
jgi:hypothetical protein